MQLRLRRISAVAALALGCSAQETVSFRTDDGATIYGDLYGAGTRGVVLAHGGRFNKESWRDQALALADAGYRVLAIDFRGKGNSRGPGDRAMMDAPLYHDVLGAVRYLRSHGATAVSAIGGSMGGAAAADASIHSTRGEIDAVVLLGASPNEGAGGLKSRTLFITARDDANSDGPRLPGIRAQFDKAPQPKEMIVLDGSAHAQFLFQTEHAARIMREIVRFLDAGRRP